MAVAWWVNALALAFGGFLGARAFLDPNWAARFVRLKPDDQGGGFAEFRATYGGLFAAAHIVALMFSARYIIDGEFVIGVAATGAAAVMGAGWAGSCAGRVLAIWRDDARTRFNVISAGVEAVLALAIAAPWLVWAFS